MTDFYSDEHMARFAMLSRAFDYIFDDYSDECEHCKQGVCVQRVEYYLDRNGMPTQHITHGVQGELN